MRQTGFIDGIQNEIDFVIAYNKNPQHTIFIEYNSSLNINNLYLVHITQKQYSSLSQRRVSTRADIYAVTTTDPAIVELLKCNNYYLSDILIADSDIQVDVVKYSGISVKLYDSNYQLIKLTPHSFCNLFGSYELGAAASLYCLRDTELYKNDALLSGWNCTLESMNLFFDNYSIDSDFIINKDMCYSLKQSAQKTIESLINQNIKIQQMIFNGINIYEEPYTAHYFTNSKTLTALTTVPFTITTGSGRSRGDYTIVLKPK